jgi:hypothetical protein
MNIRPTDSFERSDFQRPDCSCEDPRGGFRNNPRFEIVGSIDNGGSWDSRRGNSTNRFVNS